MVTGGPPRTFEHWARAHADQLQSWINPNCEVIDIHRQVIPSLYCAGEAAGGFALHGLPRVTVFGRIAGREAARAVSSE